MSNKGFTLIELLIVLVIVGLMAAMVSPTISRSLSSLTLKTAARKVAAALRYARSQAITKAEVYQAVFNLEGKQVTISPVEDEGEQAEEGEKLQGEEEEQKSDEREKPKVYTLPDEVKFLEVVAGEEEVFSGDATITFHPNGGSEGGQIIISDEEEKREYRILVNFLTGAVEIEEKD
jgi:general secretion pathway protein H